MSLTDLEICKRIAEIEGKKGIIVRPLGDGKNHVTVRFTECTGYIKCVAYNPLTDDALCLQLMLKHKISVDFRADGRVQAFIDSEKTTKCVTDKTPNKAICLAIIKANNR